MEFPSEEGPGLSVFLKDSGREIYHTYSSYARGLDILVGTYNFLDLAPKGRDRQVWRIPWHAFDTTTSTMADPSSTQRRHI